MTDPKRTSDEKAIDQTSGTKDASVPSDLPDPSLTEKDAASVKGGATCTSGVHLKEATITY